MNRLDTSRGKYYANGMEVSRHTYFYACNQNVMIEDRRLRLRNKRAGRTNKTPSGMIYSMDDLRKYRYLAYDPA